MYTKRPSQLPLRGKNLLFIFLIFFLAGCAPPQPQMVEVTEVVHLGDEQIIITRVIEIVPTPTSTPEPPGDIEMPVTLDLAFTEALPQLDPQQAQQQNSYNLVENLFIGLTNFNHQTEKIEPELAESWSVSPDGLHWTFNLRDDVSWLQAADPPLNFGQEWTVDPVRPVTAQDVVNTFHRICDRRTNTPDAFIFFIIQGCEAVYVTEDPEKDDFEHIGVTAQGENTVTFDLNEPGSYILTLLTLPQARPVPIEQIDEFGSEMRDNNGDLINSWQSPENILTNGPFLPSATIFSDDTLQLNQNPLWPMPITGNIDTININLQMDEDEIYEAFQDKILDISGLPLEMREEFLEKTPSKAKLITNQTVFYLGFNFESAVFSEPQVRRAFSASVDREQLIEELFEGRGLPLRHFTPPGTFGAPPLNETGLGFSPDLARQEMDRSSFRNCRLIPPITFLVSTADLSLLQAEIVRRMWIRELDCEEQSIILEQVDFGLLLTNTSSDSNNKPDIWELAWPPAYPDAHSMLFDLLHCTDGENRQNRECSEADRILRQAKLTPQLEERKELYREVENLMFGEEGINPLIPLYVRGDFTIVQSWLTYNPALSGGEQFDTFIIDEELKRLERSRGL